VVDPAGQPFNPDLHEACRRSNRRGPPNHVLSVMQKGYRCTIACCGGDGDVAKAPSTPAQ